MGLIFIFPAKGNYGRRKSSTEFITSTSLVHQANSVMSLTLDFWERILMSVTWSCANMPSSFIGILFRISFQSYGLPLQLFLMEF